MRSPFIPVLLAGLLVVVAAATSPNAPGGAFTSPLPSSTGCPVQLDLPVSAFGSGSGDQCAAAALAGCMENLDNVIAGLVAGCEAYCEAVSGCTSVLETDGPDCSSPSTASDATCTSAAQGASTCSCWS
ncbi:MAG: hypothetical protein HY369_03200 [Candidatus Aenigmarchaeota archaeon]|nr:hypothetical protein [Candidatus Aenigmarchaeota archaeon]